MAHGTFLAVNLVTPRGVIAHTETDSLQAPGDLGEFELLPGHVPMLTALKAGVLTIGTKARAKYAVSTGYLRIDPEGAVEILVERAKPVAEIDSSAAQAELKAAEAELAKWGDKAHDGEWDVIKQRADWAQAQLATLAHN